MKKTVAAGALVLLLGLAACFHSELDACLAEPTYGCLIEQAARTADGAGEKTDDLVQRAFVLAYVVRVMAETGDQDAAKDHLATANGLQAGIRIAAKRDIVLPVLVRANALMGRLDIARKFIARIEDSYSLALAYAWLAYAQASRGDQTGAVETIEGISPLLDGIEPYKRSNVTGWVAVAEAAAGRRQPALELAEAVHEYAASQASPARRVSGFATAAIALAEAGFQDKARGYLGDAAAALRSLEDESPPAPQLGGATAFLVWAQAASGETEQARINADKLLKLVPGERQPARRTVLLGIAAFAFDHARR